MRTLNRFLSLLLGAALTVAGVVTLLEVGAAATGLRPLLVDAGAWAATLQDTPLRSGGPLLLAGGLAVAGLALLVAETRRWPATRVRLERHDTGLAGELRMDGSRLAGERHSPFSAQDTASRPSDFELQGVVRRSPAGQSPDHVATGAWWLPRSAAERYVRQAVRRGTSASRVRVRLLATEPVWRLRVVANGPPDLHAEVEQRARQALARMSAPAGCQVRVRLHGREPA